MSDDKKMNIFMKLQKSRVELQNKKIKKSGKNKYSNYDYFELGDFLPQINEICLNNGLSTIFHFRTDVAVLSVIDIDNPEDIITFETPIELASLKGCVNIQNIGGTQTYARRYLYMMAFEIAESDFIDSGNVEKDDEGPNEKINDIKVSTIYDLIEKTNSNMEEFLKYYKVKKVEDLTNKKFAACMQLLNKKLKENEIKNQVTPTENEDFEF